MDTVIEVVAIVFDFVVLPVYLVAIVTCVLKGHRAAAWVGTLALVIGGATALPLFKALRARDAESLLLVAWACGLAVVAVVVAVALRPAQLGSRWARGHDHRSRRLSHPA